MIITLGFAAIIFISVGYFVTEKVIPKYTKAKQRAKEMNYLEFIVDARNNTPDPDQAAALFSTVPPVVNYPKTSDFTLLPEKFRVF